jgi:hypothetical protein
MPTENSPQNSAQNSDRPDVPTHVDIRNPEAVRTLLNHKQRQAFRPFMRQSISISEAASLVGESLNTMLKRVQRWLEYGLLIEMTGSAGPATGQPKRYTAAAESFFVPQSVIARLDLEQLLKQLDAFEADIMRRGQLEAALRIDDWGLRFTLDNDQDWNIQPARTGMQPWNYKAPDAPAILAETNVLELGFADAKALQRELMDVVRKYLNRSGDGRYIVRLGMAPVPEDFE